MTGPFTKREQQVLQDAYGRNYSKSLMTRTWYRSPRVNGVLKLAPQIFSETRKEVLSVSYKWNPPSFAPPQLALAGVYATSDPAVSDALLSATNESYAKLISKLRGEHTAGLGVNLAQWKQSWGMISNRVKMIQKFVDAAKLAMKPTPEKTKTFRSKLRWLKTPRKLRKRRVPKTPRAGDSADKFLEVQFGWLPILTDIYNTALALTDPIPYQFVSKSASSSGQFLEYSTPTYKESGTFSVRVTQSALVSVSNPNLWLANKLGLINPATVLWDAVPWSFVVNRFVNLNAVMASFTDTVGLEVNSASVTTRIDILDSQFLANNYPVSHPGYATGSGIVKRTYKARSVGNLYTPKIQTRSLKTSMTQALIDLSLLTQQISRLRK